MSIRWNHKAHSENVRQKQKMSHLYEDKNHFVKLHCFALW